MTAALTIRSSSCKIENCTIRNTRGTGISLNQAKPILDNNAFSANTNRDIILGLNQLNGFEGNNVWKIGLIAEAMTANATIDPADGVFKILAPQTVPEGTILTILPGTEIEFPYGSGGITVSGTLLAAGTSTDSIHFTGTGFYGCCSSRGPITIEATSVNSVLQHVDINGLGYGGNTDMTAALTIRSSSCKIENCTIRNTRGTG